MPVPHDRSCSAFLSWGPGTGVTARPCGSEVSVGLHLWNVGSERAGSGALLALYPQHSHCVCRVVDAWGYLLRAQPWVESWEEEAQVEGEKWGKETLLCDLQACPHAGIARPT